MLPEISISVVVMIGVLTYPTGKPVTTGKLATPGKLVTTEKPVTTGKPVSFPELDLNYVYNQKLP